MLTSIRGLTAASLSAGMLFAAAPAFAAEASDEVIISEDLIAASAALDNTANEDETLLTTRVDDATVVRAGKPIDDAIVNDVATHWTS